MRNDLYGTEIFGLEPSINIMVKYTSAVYQQRFLQINDFQFVYQILQTDFMAH